LQDIEFVQNKIDDLEKSMKRSNDKQLKLEHELCEKVKAHLEDGKDVRFGDWKSADIEILNTFQLLTAKPVVYLVRIFVICMPVYLRCYKVVFMMRCSVVLCEISVLLFSCFCI
jgi:hypothetical protein